MLQVIPNLLGGPVRTGGIFGQIQAIATASQTLTNVDQLLLFDTTTQGGLGPVKRVGSEFHILEDGAYLAFLEPQVLQLKNNNDTFAWVSVNDIVQPNSAALFSASAINDNGVLSVTFAGVLKAGDIIKCRASTSVSAGSQLQYVPAAAPHPAVAAISIIILAYKI